MTNIPHEMLDENTDQFALRIKEEIECQYEFLLSELKPCMEESDFNALEKVLLSSTYVAGGYFRSRFLGNQPNDIDIGFNSAEERDYIYSLLRKINHKYKRVGLSITANGGIQIRLLVGVPKSTKDGISNIPKCLSYSFNALWTAPPLEVLSSFDFYHNVGFYCVGTQQFFYYYNKTVSYDKTTSLQIIPDNLKKEEDAFSSLIRGARFASEGYTFDRYEVSVALAFIIEKNKFKKETVSPDELLRLDKNGSNTKTFIPPNKEFLAILQSRFQLSRDRGLKETDTYVKGLNKDSLVKPRSTPEEIIAQLRQAYMVNDVNITPITAADFGVGEGTVTQATNNANIDVAHPGFGGALWTQTGNAFTWGTDTVRVVRNPTNR